MNTVGNLTGYLSGILLIKKDLLKISIGYLKADFQKGGSD